jgi:hypothetical protein
MKALLTALCLTTGLTSMIMAAPSIDDLGISKKSARLHAVQPKAVAKKLKAKKLKAARKLKSAADRTNMTSLLGYFKATVRAVGAYDAGTRNKKFFTNAQQAEANKTSAGVFGTLLSPLLNIGNISTELRTFMGYAGGTSAPLPTITAGTNDLAGITTRLGALEATSVVQSQVSGIVAGIFGGATNVNNVLTLSASTTQLTALAGASTQLAGLAAQSVPLGLLLLQTKRR